MPGVYTCKAYVTTQNKGKKGKQRGKKDKEMEENKRDHTLPM